MKERRSNNSNNIRLRRRVDRFLPFNFKNEHLSGTRMWRADYISREPHLIAPNIIQYDKQLIVANLALMKQAV